MGLEGYYGPIDRPKAAHVLTHARGHGCTFFDTADAYGLGHNEQLLGSVFEGERAVTIATKGGIVFEPGTQGTRWKSGRGYHLTLNGTRDHILRAVDASLRRLRRDQIDLWFLHFPDPATPIEESVAAMSEAVADGKIRHLGLSNVTPDQVRRAATIHPIAAVQFEYSLWRREPEADLLPVLRELGIALVPWSPLGSGLLSGQVPPIPAGDVRALDPRYSPENLSINQDRFAFMAGLAASEGCTIAQLALAWLLHQRSDIIPIPATRDHGRLKENLMAAHTTLRPETLEALMRQAPPGAVAGGVLV
jgi:aryl-alcohol dehydrogenase-like predicted oxidoreductase